MKPLFGWVVFAVVAVSTLAHAQVPGGEDQLLGRQLKHGTTGPFLRPFTADPWATSLFPNHRWTFAGTDLDQYVAGTDDKVLHEGRPSAYLRSAVPDADGFASVTQQRSASAFRGKRVRVSAWLRAEGLTGTTGLWMRVDRPNKPAVAFDNLRHRAAGKPSSEWVRSEVVLDVPADAVEVSFGLVLNHAGTAWVNGLTVEEVELSVPSTELGI